MWEEIILTFAVLGVVINVVAFVIISRKKDKSMFHDLLKVPIQLFLFFSQ